jgi:hypothetical protein
MVITELTKQLDDLVSEVSEFRSRSAHDDCSDVMSETKAVEISTRASAAIERIAGRKSPYHVRAEDIRAERAYEQLKVMRLVGVLQSLSADLKAGYLRSVEELIHGELFGDFLEMAQHLVDQGYKDAAAVIAGSALEAHLRQLAKRFGVTVESVTAKGTEPKKADVVNAELVKAGGYSGLDQKNVTAWLGLRNKAAHGQYAEYQRDQVALMIDAVRDFTSRHPA